MNILVIGNISDNFKNEFIKRGHEGTMVFPFNLSFLIKDGVTHVYAGSVEILPNSYDGYLITEAKLEYLRQIKACCDALEAIGIPPFRSIESAMMCKNKNAVSLLAASLGIRVPNQACIASPEFMGVSLSQIQWPVVFKEIDRSVGNGIIYVDSPLTMKPMCEMVYGKDYGFKSYNVQEFIDAGFEDERYIVCDGQIVNAMKRKANKGDFRANLGRGGDGETITQIDDETREMVLKIVKNIDGLYYGGVDIIRKDGVPYFIEVNYQPGEHIIDVNHKNHFVEFIDFMERRVKEFKGEMTD